jgi:hypothetical protein
MALRIYLLFRLHLAFAGHGDICRIDRREQVTPGLTLLAGVCIGFTND